MPHKDVLCHKCFYFERDQDTDSTGEGACMVNGAEMYENDFGGHGFSDRMTRTDHFCSKFAVLKKGRVIPLRELLL